MIILVTGARGAIGRHVVAAAKQRDAGIIGLGHGTWSGEPELPAIDRWINGDVTADNLDILCQDTGKPDVVIHLAGGSHVGASIEHPSEDFRRTVSSAQNLFEWLRIRSPQSAVVIASSAAVYGNASQSPISETASFAPTSPYGTHKAVVEMLARTHAQQYGLRLAIVRLFSVYGPGLRKQLVFELMHRLHNRETGISLGGTGNEERDFLYIADAADMLLDAAAHASNSAPVFNGATGVAVATRDLARKISENDPGVSISFTGVSRKGDPLSLVGDVTRARAAGLKAPTDLASGLAATRSWVANRWGQA